MTHIFFVFTFLLAGSATAFGQCGKNLMLTSSKTEYLDSTGVLQRAEDEKSTIDINRSEIIIVPGNDAQKISGTIKSDTCSWKVPFKEGRTIYQVMLNREGESPMAAALTIEGKDGKLTLLVEIKEMRDRKIRAVIDRFEEKK